MAQSAEGPAKQSFRKTLRETVLFNGPGKSHGRIDETLPKDSPVFFDGVSLNEEWARIVLYDGRVFWTPIFNISSQEEIIDNEKGFRYNMEARRSFVSDVALQLGGSYGSRPMLLRAGGALFWNFVPEGLVDYRYDQTEIGISGSCLIGGNVDPFYHASVLLQWLYRAGEERRFLIGPRIGWAVMNDPNSNLSFSHFLVGGLSLRHYFFEYLGYYMEAEIFARSVVYYMGSAGLTLRF